MAPLLEAKAVDKDFPVWPVWVGRRGRFVYLGSPADDLK